MALGIEALIDNVESEVQRTIESKCGDYSREFEGVVAKAKEELAKLVKERPMVVVKDGVSREVKGLKHKNLDRLIQLVGAKQNVLLVGSAGTGKTKSVEQVAEALGLTFSCISVGSQTSKSDLLGYMNAEGKYTTTAFRNAYENGGVFCMDEIDAGNSNVLIVLNSALSNGVCAFPDKIVKASPDFRFVGTANTYGNGADRTYVGRNQLDGATLDRFIVIDWEVDEELEKALVSDYKDGTAWLETMWDLRKEVERNGIRAIISPRMTIRCAVCWELGNTVKNVIEMCVLPQIPSDKRKTYATRVEEQFTTRRKRIEKEEKERKKAEQEKKAGTQGKFEMELPF